MRGKPARSTGTVGTAGITFPLFDLTGRRALVTGSSQGIGLALAEGLAAHGAEVVLNGRDAAKLAAAADGLVARGYRVAPAPFDVTDPEAAAAGVAAVLADGPIDILVNNAGMQFRTPLEDFPVDKLAAAPDHQRLEHLLRQPAGRPRR